MKKITYTIRSTEMLRAIGSEGETKALLYLASFYKDSDEIKYFAIDCFNDVTGMSQNLKKLWDVQSKAKRKCSSNDIGEGLVTLFKNYLSDITFNEYILFLNSVNDKIRIDNTKNIFGIDNINPTEISVIKSKFKKTYGQKTYIDNSIPNIEKEEGDFFKKISIVVNNRSEIEYIKKIINTNIDIKESKLNEAFNAVKKFQSSIKENKSIENSVIHSIKDVFDFKRVIDIEKIKIIIVNAILHYDIQSKNVPFLFSPLLISNNITDQNFPEECRKKIIKSIFDKNFSNKYWEIFQNIYELIYKNQIFNVLDIFDNIDTKIKKKCKQYFDDWTLKYFISIIIGAIEHDNKGNIYWQ